MCLMTLYGPEPDTAKQPLLTELNELSLYMLWMALLYNDVLLTTSCSHNVTGATSVRSPIKTQFWHLASV